MKRAVVIVLDSVGIGEMPDAHKFGDVGSNTLVNIKKNVSSLNIDNLCSLGLGNIDGKDIELLGKTKNPLGSFGKMAERSFGKDTTTGHWEIAGIITENPFPTFSQNGFPPDIIGQLENETGLSFLGNLAASGTEIINTLGDYHVNSGFPIIYTSNLKPLSSNFSIAFNNIEWFLLCGLISPIAINLVILFLIWYFTDPK